MRHCFGGHCSALTWPTYSVERDGNVLFFFLLFFLQWRLFTHWPASLLGVKEALGWCFCRFLPLFFSDASLRIVLCYCHLLRRFYCVIFRCFLFSRRSVSLSCVLIGFY